MKDIKFGFEIFEEAEKFAQEHNGEIHSFRKRNGDWRWQDEGTAIEAYNLYAFYDSQDCHQCYPCVYPDEGMYFQNVAQYDLYGCDRFEDAFAILEYHKHIWDELSECGEDEFVVVLYNGSIIEKMPTQAMRFSYDVYTYEIGVVYEE